MRKFFRENYFSIILHGLIWSALIVGPALVELQPILYARIGFVTFNFVVIANVLHCFLFYFNAFYLFDLLTKSRWWIYVLSAVALLMLVNGIKGFLLKTIFIDLVSSHTPLRFAFFPTVFFLVVSIIYRLVLDKIKFEKSKSSRQAEQLATELRFLRSQVSPHFLFNVLNNLVAMARYKSDKLEHSLLKLSGLMRYMLYESDERKVNITTEIDYLNSYIELQKLRFEDDIEIATEMDYDTSSDFSIEPMLLIPFVENAFKHGVSLVEKPFIYVRLKIAGNNLNFSVRNRFSRDVESKDANSGIGLSNVKARLSLLYRDNYTLAVQSQESIFTINLSLKLS